MKTTIKMTALSLLILLLFPNCATMFRTNQATVSAASGANSNVQVMENGILIYNGTLPAQFSVKSGRTYTVEYKLDNGETRTVTIAEKFNVWFIGSIILAVVPVVVDLVTGSVMTIERSTILPISYSQEILLGENIPYHENLKIIGNIFYEG